MSDGIADQPEPIVPFAPKQRAWPDGNLVADDAGQAIIALLKKAADYGKGRLRTRDGPRPQAIVSAACC
jgi:hypothetical protein